MNRKNLISIGAIAAVAAFGAGAVLLKPEPQPQPAASLEEAAASIVDVAVPESLGAQAQMGKRAFEAKCAECHGVNAAGQEGVAPPLVHKIYEPSHHGDAAFLLAAQNGVRSHHWPFGNMPPVEGITAASVKDIVAYVRELQRNNGIE